MFLFKFFNMDGRIFNINMWLTYFFWTVLFYNFNILKIITSLKGFRTIALENTKIISLLLGLVYEHLIIIHCTPSTIISSVMLPPVCRKYLHIGGWFDIAKTGKNSDNWRSKSTLLLTLRANFQPEQMSESRYYLIYVANTLWKMSNWFQHLKLPRGTTLLWKNSSLSLSSLSLCQ